MSRGDTLLHPVRMRIVQAIGAVGEASAKALREDLKDVAPATLYRHVKALHEAGFLEVASERRSRGAVERSYRLVEGRAVLGPADIEGMTGEQHLGWFRAFTATLVDAFGRYTRRRAPDLVADRVRYRLVPMLLSDEEATAFAAELDALCLRYHGRERREDRARRLFGFVTVKDE